MRRRSTSRELLTRNALWPEGIRWRVFLLEPYPICKYVRQLRTLRYQYPSIAAQMFLRNDCSLCSRTAIEWGVSHLWHSSLALEASSDTIVDTLRFPPARVDAFEAIALVTVEALRICYTISLDTTLRSRSHSKELTEEETSNHWQGAVRGKMRATYASSQ
jgi:hypothetical protein